MALKFAIFRGLAAETVILRKMDFLFGKGQTRTRLFQKFCIPSSIPTWNELEQEVKNITTFNSFKLKLNSMTKPKRIPNLYFFGNRYLSIIQARIRNCSYLNNDLFLNHLKSDPIRFCGTGAEDAEHIFLNAIDTRTKEPFFSKQQWHFTL